MALLLLFMPVLYQWEPLIAVVEASLVDLEIIAATKSVGQPPDPR